MTQISSAAKNLLQALAAHLEDPASWYQLPDDLLTRGVTPPAELPALLAELEAEGLVERHDCGEPGTDVYRVTPVVRSALERAGGWSGEVRNLWPDYPCEEYFRDGWYRRGHFDERGQWWVIVPLREGREDPDAAFLAVGGAGVDGIGFGYRRGMAGVWAFYPIGREWKLMAASLAELVEGYCSGSLRV